MDAVVNLLIQIPLVGIFVWFVLQRDKRDDKRDQEMREFLRQQREEDHNVMVQIAELLREHDKKTDTAIRLMEDRTSLTNPPSRPRKAAS